MRDETAEPGGWLQGPGPRADTTASAGSVASRVGDNSLDKETRSDIGCVFVRKTMLVRSTVTPAMVLTLWEGVVLVGADFVAFLTE